MRLSKALLLMAAVSMIPSGLRAEPVRAGWTELVSFPQQKAQLKAKLDTGAKTSALNGHDQRRFQRGGTDWISFVLTGTAGEHMRIERPILRLAKIRRAGVPTETRPVVAMMVCAAGITQRTEFTVTDRRGMAFPVLLGRRFLAGRIVVDAGAQGLNDGACGS
ncbi:MAG: hypothetical protein GY948_25210 [Alphaproteobacteria bacterium]|nr:hypothetical protein [Alphaproteobacteria bacterium]